MKKKECIDLLLKIINDIRNENYAIEFINGGYSYSKEITTISKILDTSYFQNVLVENYPDLKANTTYIELQRSIVDCEEHLQAARRLYNSNVTEFNKLLVVFPSSVVAGMKNLTKQDFFEVEEEKKQDVKINL